MVIVAPVPRLPTAAAAVTTIAAVCDGPPGRATATGFCVAPVTPLVTVLAIRLRLPPAKILPVNAGALGTTVVFVFCWYRPAGSTRSATAQLTGNRPELHVYEF